MLADTWHLFNKYMRISIRMPLWSLFSLIQPLIWLIIFGQLFSNMANIPGFPTQNYTDFFLPGVIIMTVLFGSSWSGVSLLREITAGTVDKMLVSPVSRISIVLSRLLHSAAQVIVQVIIILIIAAFMGAQLNYSPVGILLALFAVLLLALSFAALSNGFAILLQREEPLVIIGNMMTLPLMFFSTALVPIAFMPEWIQYISVINPINYAVEAVRAVLVGEYDFAAFQKGILVLLVFTAATMFWAIRAFSALRD